MMEDKEAKEEFIEALAATSRGLTAPKDLVIDGSVAKVLAESLHGNKSLVQLNLDCVSFEEGISLSDVWGALNNAKSLSSLSIGESVLSEARVGEISAMIQANSNIRFLSLQRAGITDKGGIALAAAIKANSVLWSLNLAGNLIKDDGAQAIADAVKDNTGMRMLYLNNNRIGEQGIAHLAASTLVNIKIKLIDVSLNEVEELGQRKLASEWGNTRPVYVVRLTHSGPLGPLKGRDAINTSGPSGGRTYVSQTTELGRLLADNGFERLAPAFISERVYTINDAAKLTREELKAFGNLTLAERSELHLLIAQHSGSDQYKTDDTDPYKTEVGKLLIKNRLSEYAKNFYDDDVYEVEPLTKANLHDIGVKNPRHVDLLYALFNGLTPPRYAEAGSGEGSEKLVVAIPVAQEEEEVHTSGAQEIEKYHDLYERGILSLAEFEHAKKRILDSL